MKPETQAEGNCIFGTQTRIPSARASGFPEVPFRSAEYQKPQAVGHATFSTGLRPWGFTVLQHLKNDIASVPNTVAVDGFFQKQLSPPHDVAAVPQEKPWFFLEAPFWKKAVDGFFQIQLVLFVEGGIELTIARGEVEVVHEFAGLGCAVLAIHSAIFPFN